MDSYKATSAYNDAETMNEVVEWEKPSQAVEVVMISARDEQDVDVDVVEVTILVLFVVVIDSVRLWTVGLRNLLDLPCYWALATEHRKT